MDYIIGSGAILESGPSGGITPASFHASIGRGATPSLLAMAVDFEGTSAQDVRKMLVVVQGANPGFVRGSVELPLRAKGDCSLADVFLTLARAAKTCEVHLFAHWLPPEETCEALRSAGVTLVAHPLETIEAASVVSGQRHRRVA